MHHQASTTDPLTSPHIYTIPQNAPQESGLIARSRELLSYLANLEHEHILLRESLFGPSPENGLQRPEPVSLEQALALACERIASLVGDAATINGRLTR